MGDLVITALCFFSSPDLLKHFNLEVFLILLRLGLMSKQISCPTGTTCGFSSRGQERVPTP
jgi:hypothetical protein